MNRPGALLTTLLLLAGCESLSDVLDKHRAPVQHQFAVLQALGPRLKSAEVTLPAALTPPLVLEGAASNAMFLYAEDLAQPGFAKPVNLRTLDSAPLLQCGSLLTKQLYVTDPLKTPSPSGADALLSACARLRYALVIRERSFTPPHLALESRSFTPGSYSADVLAFDVTSGALVGGYSITAKNEGSVDLANDEDEQGHVRRLLANLESVVFASLRKGARDAFPGSLPAGP
jgi:hypothetical protein